MALRMETVNSEDGFTTKSPPMTKEQGTSFGWFDRFNVGWNADDKYVTDYSDWEARDLYEMLAKDYKARQMENVLTLPIVSAERQIASGKGGSDEITEWMEAYWDADHDAGGPKAPLDHYVDQMTSAFSYKRAYFEKNWVKGRGQFAGKHVYDSLGWRPQTTCRIMRDPHNGNFLGFEQEAYYVGPEIAKSDHWPIKVKADRAFVYTHGTRRDPLNGTSDMEIAFWAWRTKQKVLLLWLQFMQSVSLPRIIAKAQDIETANAVAKQFAGLQSSGVLPVAAANGPDSVGIDTLDVSGKGADQFVALITWLDNAATQSILAGFLNLTDRGMPMDGAGSFALSRDASDFFLQSLEAKVREMEWSIRHDLFRPLVRYNFGPKAPVPEYQFEPLNDIDKQNAITLLQAGMAAPPGGPVPVEFIAGLAGQVSQYLGLDGPTMQSAFQDSFSAAAAEAKEKAAQVGANPLGQQVAGVAGAVSAAKQTADGRPPTTPAQKAGAAAMQQGPAKNAAAAAVAAQKVQQTNLKKLSDAALAAKTTPHTGK